MIGRIQEFRRRNPKSISFAFFVLGVLLDAFTLGRIDRPFSLARLGAFLLVCGILLNLDFRAQCQPITPRGRIARMWERRGWAIHFFFGSLLSAYAVFYFKSASLLRSGVFIFVLFALLVANEIPAFKRLGHSVKFGIYALCLSSYFAILVPILLGAVGKEEFVLALVGAFGILALNGWFLFTQFKGSKAIRDAIISPLLVLTLFLGLYLAHLIPPVPLSIKFMGIYHGIEKSVGKGETRYTLLSDRPRWKIWQNGDQRFLARDGDRIHLFVRIFSPTNFRDSVELKWFRKEPRAGWALQDTIPLEIRGGREEGYRGIAAKGKFVPGLWRVQVETVDGLEIGRIYFQVIEDRGTGERIWVREAG